MKLSPTAESLFTPLAPSQRASAAADYLEYLKRREGRLDFSSRSLARREPFFEGLARDPVRSELPLDRPLFRRNHDASRPDAGLSRDMLWLLAVAKANRTEHFGMEVHIVVNGILDGDRANTQAYVDMQEVYHTRILLDVLRCFDLEITVREPDLATRLLVHAMVRLPHRVALPLILCSELVAVVIFRLLLDTGRELFGHEPRLWERLSTLLHQIMIDEVGHVTYCRAQLGGAGLSAARALLPSVKAALMAEQLEFAQLVGHERFDRAFADLELSWVTAGCNDTPFWLELSPTA